MAYPTPKPRGGRAFAGPPGNKPANPRVVIQGSNAAYAARQPKPSKPKTKVDPRTGQPVMMSDHEIRAEANAQAWKSIQQMQSAVPSEDAARTIFTGQRNAINDLTTAHRDWLERAGQYHVNMTNALSGAATGAAATGDATAGAGAAAAGGPLGASFAGNVAPSAVGTGSTDAGTTFQKIIAGELTGGYPQAIGANALAKINQNELETISGIRDERNKIGGGLAELQQKNYESGYQVAIDKYKSELAAIALAGKNRKESAAAAETKRYHTGMLGLSEDRNAIARGNAEVAYQKMLNAASDTGGSDKRTAGDASNIQAALAKADQIYHPKAGKPGTEQPTRYGTVLTIPKYHDDDTDTDFPAQYKTISAPTRDGAVQMIKDWFRKYPKAGWTQPNLVKGYDNKPTPAAAAAPENVRRQRAWRTLTSANALLLHPWSEAELKVAFRSMAGKPKGAK